MYIETVEDLANQLADWYGIYGNCKSENNEGCTYKKCAPLCCRVGFVGSMEERIREAVQSDEKITLLGIS